MLFLLFQIGRDRYALEASQVAVVLPLTRFKQVPGAPLWVAGLFSYRGKNVPVIDVSQLALGRAADARLSSRLVLAHYTPAGQAPQLLGLIVEKATDTLRCEPDAFADSGLLNQAAPYLGPVMQHRDGMIQRIALADILPASAQALLFPESVTS
ncbi:chemotaxis protein CheW [Herbaspirillum lusitanum]|jgi:chemotaxis-related protein WspB|uniref:Chemotaxis protein CheW n=1 Tax=Herbaspirillum lusitanum TaxID=213312 RepID=A0ABW9AEK9_9BURK